MARIEIIALRYQSVKRNVAPASAIYFTPKIS